MHSLTSPIRLKALLSSSNSTNRQPLVKACALVLVMLLAAAGHAQTTKIAWKEAIKLIDSTSPADVLAGSNMLKQSARDTTLPPAAILSHVLFQLRSDNAESAEKALLYLDRQVSPDRLGHLTGLRLRAKLAVAIVKEDKAAATTAFKDLVRYIVRAEGDPLDLRAAAHTIGMTVGMLENIRSGNLIDTAVLKVGTNCLRASKIRGANFAYETAYAQAQERAVAIAAQLDAIDKNGIDTLKVEYAKRIESLKARQAELQQQKELTGEVARNSREQTGQNKVDLRQVARDIAKLTNQLSQPTPGHPGPKLPPPPPPPPRSSIPVEEYIRTTEYRYETRNGQEVRVPYTREERRSQSDIDRERDSKYQSIVSQYTAAVANYRSYETMYNNDLQSWTQTDRARRQDLSQRKAEAESQRENLMQANKDIEDERRDYAKELRDKRTAEEQEEFDLQMIQIALEASMSGKPESAYRPKNFGMFNLSQEKILLQR